MAVDKSKLKGATEPLDSTPTPVERGGESTSGAPLANPYAQLTTPATMPKPAEQPESSEAKPLAGAAAPSTALAGQAAQPTAQPASQPVAQPASVPTTTPAATPGPGPGGGDEKQTKQPQQPVENPYSGLTDSAAPGQFTYQQEQVSPHVTAPDASKVDKTPLKDAPMPPPDTMPLGSNAIAGNAATPQAAGAAAERAEAINAPPQAAQTASGFINFDQLYGANSGVAKRESDKRANDAMASAKKAQQELAALQAQYTKQVNSGTLQGPSEADQGWAQYGDGVQEAPIRPAPGQEILQPSNSDIAGEINAGANGGYGGPSALSALDAYGQLTQDTTAAQQGIGALQSNEGLQGLGLNQTDAALLGGAGRSQFAKLGDKYGGLQKDLDAANASSIGQADDARSKSDAARDAYRGLLDQRSQTDNASQTGNDTAQPNDPATMSIDDLLAAGGESAWSDLHQLGLSLSPADQADIELADATNTDMPLATEAFSSATGGAIAGASGIENSWGPARVRMAYDKVTHEFDSDAMSAFRKALQSDQSLLHKYLAMKNPGYMAHQMRQWLLDHGFTQHGAQHTNQPQTGTYGNTGTTYTDPSGQQRTTTDQQEQDRTFAYRQGWGEEWDKQFNSGNDNPQKP
jgi:hypothetical protein